jgi:hypothetical protein
MLQIAAVHRPVFCIRGAEWQKKAEHKAQHSHQIAHTTLPAMIFGSCVLLVLSEFVTVFQRNGSI